MRPPARLLAPAVALALMALCLTASAPASPSSQAHAARTLSIRDEGKLHFLRSSGSTLTDEGHATGTIPARVKIRFVYNGNPNVSSNITIYAPHGTIALSARGRLSSPTNPNPSFSGTMTITGGSGRYAHAHGTGKLYGVFHRRSYSIVVQTQGTMQY